MEATGFLTFFFNCFHIACAFLKVVSFILLPDDEFSEAAEIEARREEAYSLEAFEDLMKHSESIDQLQ